MMIMVKEGNASRFVVEKASLRLFVDGVRLGEYDAALGDFGFPLYGRVLAGQVRIVWMESDRKEEEENIEGDRTTVCCMHKETMCDIMYIYIVTKRHRGREIERMLTVYVCVCVAIARFDFGNLCVSSVSPLLHAVLVACGFCMYVQVLHNSDDKSRSCTEVGTKYTSNDASADGKLNSTTVPVALVERGGCYFAEKAYYAQKAGAKAVLIMDDQVEPLITVRQLHCHHHPS